MNPAREREQRREVLERIATGGLLPDPLLRVQVLSAYRRTTEHGVDLWWCRYALEQVAKASPPAKANAAERQHHERAQQAATAALATFFDHFLKERGERALAELAALGRRLFPDAPDPLDAIWREIPAGEGVIGSPEGVDHRDERPRFRLAMGGGLRMLAVPVTNSLYECFDPGHRSDCVFRTLQPWDESAAVGRPGRGGAPSQWKGEQRRADPWWGVAKSSHPGARALCIWCSRSDRPDRCSAQLLPVRPSRSAGGCGWAGSDPGAANGHGRHRGSGGLGEAPCGVAPPLLLDGAVVCR